MVFILFQWILLLTFKNLNQIPGKNSCKNLAFLALCFRCLLTEFGFAVLQTGLRTSKFYRKLYLCLNFGVHCSKSLLLKHRPLSTYLAPKFSLEQQNDYSSIYAVYCAKYCIIIIIFKTHTLYADIQLLQTDCVFHVKQTQHRIFFTARIVCVLWYFFKMWKAAFISFSFPKEGKGILHLP